MKNIARDISLLLVALVALSTTVTADEVYARIRGTVTDASGAVVQGAEVTATNTGTGLSKKVASDADGSGRKCRLADIRTNNFGARRKVGTAWSEVLLLSYRSLTLAVRHLFRAASVSDRLARFLHRLPHCWS